MQKKMDQIMKRDAQKSSKKYAPEKTNNEILGLKSIAEMRKQSIGAMMREQLSLAWYFNAWYEKVILLIMFALGTWKIVGWIW